MSKPYHRNPRSVTKKRLDHLTDTLARLGDLGGIVHNLETDEIIGGNQRTRIFGEASQTEIVTRLDAPDEQGTVAHGFIVWRGKRYAYRQVRWDEDTAAEANIVANIGAGNWDADVLANQWDTSKVLEWAGMDVPAWGEVKREAAMWGEMLTVTEPMPDFQPVDESEQGRLDQKKPVTCPECGHEFIPKA